MNLRLDTLLPLSPADLQTYAGAFLADPALDVVTTRHPDHAPDEYAAIGTSWLVETTFPGPDWITSFRSTHGLG